MQAQPQRATFTVRCGDAASARALRGAVAVEARGSAGGTRVLLDDAEDPAAFVLTIEADAIGNLRAAARSCLSWLRAAGGALQAASPSADDQEV